MYQTIALCVGLLLAGNVPAAGFFYGARLDESTWNVAATRLVCSLEQKVPGYGAARFEGGRAGRLVFTLAALRPAPSSGEAHLAAAAPPWLHDVADVDFGAVAVRPGDVPVRVGEPLSQRLLSELGRGMMPTVVYQDWYGSPEPVTVAVSAVNVHPAVDEFLQCLTGLLSFDFASVERTTVYFAFGSSQLGRDARAALARVAEYAAADPQISKVVVEGRADSVGFRRYNQRLSQKRAEAVKNYLASKGIAANRITIEAYGEGKPTASNRNARSRTTNRSVVVTLVK